MALRNILIEGEPTLEKTARPVTRFDRRLHDLLDDLAETMDNANGVGLAAPQVGVLRRVAVVCDGDDIIELINPEIISESGEQSGVEGCLSVPGRYGIVTRPYTVRVRAQDRRGAWFEIEGEELLARGICHELEHLDGHLYTERVERYLTDEEIEELMKEEQ